MIFIHKQRVAPIFIVCPYALVLVVEIAETPPAPRNPLQEVPYHAVCVQALHLPEVGVHARLKRREEAHADMLVPPSYLEAYTVHHAVVDVHSVEPERRADERTTLGVVLAISLERVQLVSHPRDASLHFLHIQKPLSLVPEHPPHIVDEASVTKVVSLRLPVVEVVKCVVALHLPVLVSQGRAAPRVTRHDNALVWLDKGPFPFR